MWSGTDGDLTNFYTVKTTPYVNGLPAYTSVDGNASTVAWAISQWGSTFNNTRVYWTPDHTVVGSVTVAQTLSLSCAGYSSDSSDSGNAWSVAQALAEAIALLPTINLDDRHSKYEIFPVPVDGPPLRGSVATLREMDDIESVIVHYVGPYTDPTPLHIEIQRMPKLHGDPFETFSTGVFADPIPDGPWMWFDADGMPHLDPGNDCTQVSGALKFNTLGGYAWCAKSLLYLQPGLWRVRQRTEVDSVPISADGFTGGTIEAVDPVPLPPTVPPLPPPPLIGYDTTLTLTKPLTRLTFGYPTADTGGKMVEYLGPLPTPSQAGPGLSTADSGLSTD